MSTRFWSFLILFPALWACGRQVSEDKGDLEDMMSQIDEALAKGQPDER